MEISSASDASPEANKALITLFWQLFDAAKVDASGQLNVAGRLDSILDPDFVLHYTDVKGSGPASMKDLVRDTRTAVPNFELTVEEQLAAEGDKVVTRWKLRGHHTGEARDVKPSGELVTLYGTSIFRVSRGKIAESWMSIWLVRVIHITPLRWIAAIFGK